MSTSPPYYRLISPVNSKWILTVFAIYPYDHLVVEFKTGTCVEIFGTDANDFYNARALGGRYVKPDAWGLPWRFTKRPTPLMVNSDCCADGWPSRLIMKLVGYDATLTTKTGDFVEVPVELEPDGTYLYDLPPALDVPFTGSWVGEATKGGHTYRIETRCVHGGTGLVGIHIYVDTVDIAKLLTTRISCLPLRTDETRTGLTDLCGNPLVQATGFQLSE